MSDLNLRAWMLGVALAAGALGAAGCDDEETGSAADAAGGAGAEGGVGGAGAEGGEGGEGGAGAEGGIGGEGGVGGAGAEGGIGGEGGVGGAGAEGGEGGEGGVGGEGGEGGTPLDLPTVAGDYVDDFGGTSTVDATAWIQTYGNSLLRFDFVSVDNAGATAVARNADANAFSPGRFSRFDWAQAAGDTFFCQTAYDAATADEAAATPRADDADPAATGCGNGNPWTRLLPGISIAGRYTDDFGFAQRVASGFWQQGEGAGASWFYLLSFDEAARFAVAENAASNGFSPGLFSRFDWVEFGGALYFCQTTFDAASAEDAAATPAADPADPTAGGCGGFAWSQLTPVE